MRCTSCRAALVDADGNPSWELYGGGRFPLRFVCRVVCRPPPLVAPFSHYGLGRAVTTAAAPVLAGAGHG